MRNARNTGPAPAMAGAKPGVMVTFPIALNPFCLLLPGASAEQALPAHCLVKRQFCYM
jgi:hypothetical protein